MKKQIIFLCLTLLSLVSYAQTTVTVKGVVADVTDNEPLIGAAVRVLNAATGVSTNIDGEYVIPNVPNSAILEISYVGYETQQVKVDGRTVIDVLMRPTSAQLEEVVVIGYGTVKKSDLTSSITTVKSQQITEVTTGNAMDALQGKVSGVQISSGGGPGTTPKVTIRGITTVNGSDPLYVVDGMPVGNNINFLNSNDIESMEVLKDASASAIYGTRGSNGVILITTKKGKAGKTNVSFSASVGFQNIEKPAVAQAEEYEAVFNTRYKNDGRTSPWSGPTGITNAEGTDWWDETINKTAMVQNYALGINGGNEKYVYSLSFGYFRNESQYDYGYWDKMNMRLNSEWMPCKEVKFGIELAPTVQSWDNTPGLFGAAIGMDPTTPVRSEDGSYARSHNNQEWNPVASVSRMDAHTRAMSILASPYLQVSPIEQIVFRTQFGANATFQRSDNFNPIFWIDALEKNDQNSVSRKYNENLDWNWTNTLTFMETFNKVHNLTVMAGFTAERYAGYDLWGQRADIPGVSDLLHEVSAGTGEQQSSGGTSYNTLASVLGRLMYNYDNRYYVTASVRSDGSSKFPAGNKWATFPSISLAWRIAQEQFMSDIDLLNDLKLRLGWGKVGNQAIPNSAFIAQLTGVNYVFNGNRYPGFLPSNLANTNLKWETVEDYDIGIDFLALNSRLSVTADFYVKKSHDMLYYKEFMNSAGYPGWNSSVLGNIGSMKATGWEVAVNWRDQVSDFRYDVGVQLSGVRNKAIKFTGDGAIETGTNLGVNSFICYNEDGGLISRFYGYQTDGIFQSWEDVYSHTDEHGNLIQPSARPGDIKFIDRNHDGKLTREDKTYIGNPYPDLTMGVNLSLGYKNWDLTANFYGTFGNDVFNLTKQRYSGNGGSNVWAGALAKAWSTDNMNNSFPRLTAADSNENYTQVSDFFVEDGSYMRCKLLTLGYTLPKAITRATSLRVYVSTQNLFTITKYDGLDPERPLHDGSVLETGIDRTNYPTPRTFLVGVDFKF